MIVLIRITNQLKSIIYYVNTIFTISLAYNYYVTLSIQVTLYYIVKLGCDPYKFHCVKQEGGGVVASSLCVVTLCPY